MDKRTKKLLDIPGVVAVGRGEKITNRQRTGRKALVVSVEEKKPLNTLKRNERIPSQVDGEETDVVQTGPIKALSFTQRERPARPGLSIGHKDITAGTFGCLVEKGNEVFILSNNHVMANSNDASIGDEILQPGPHDGGSIDSDHLANLYDFAEIQFDGPGGGDDGPPTDCNRAKLFEMLINLLLDQFTKSRTRVRTYKMQAVNTVDAAIARPVAPVAPEIINLGRIKGASDPSLDMPVHKSGRTTETTHGVVSQVDVTVRVQYGAGKVATFENQAAITSNGDSFSQGGDSGSAVINNQNQFVGLLFAGSDTVTIINPALEVLNTFKVKPR